MNVAVKVNEKFIGSIKNRVFRKRVSESKHMLKSPPAWAIDATAFDAYLPLFDSIEVYDYDNNKTYTVTKEKFNDKKISLNRGHGEQYALPLTYWEVSND